ncbi:leucine-rich repeat protein [Paenibacillus sp.]
MRYDKGRWVMILLLLSCFMTLAVLYARRSVDAQMVNETKYPRKNDTIQLAIHDGTALRVSGEGKLYADDLDVLLKSASAKKKDITDIIVEEGITEIGYNTFTQFIMLKTVKIGRDVKRIAPGALKQCESLEYLFFPAGLNQIGKDFLYACPKCRIVTNGTVGDLPEMANVKKAERVLPEVDSWKALLAAIGDGDKPPASVKEWWQ